MAGVTPAAAYRHVSDLDHLITLVAQVARQELAREMLTGVAAVPASSDPVFDAVACFEACGRGYVRFALKEGPLFRTSFIITKYSVDQPDDPDAAGVLGASIQRLIDVGLLEPERFADASLIAWSGVHGLASLLSDNVVDTIFGLSHDEALDSVLASIARSVLSLSGVRQGE